MKGIIIAAGKGGRLGALTAQTPKSLLPILGKPLIEYTLETLRACGVKDIAVVTGFQAQKFTYKDVRYHSNPEFEKNNILQSLMKAQDDFDDELVISYSDIWFSQDVLKKLLHTDGDIVISVDTDWKKRYEGRTEHPWSEAEKITMTPDGIVIKAGKHIPVDENPGEFIGLLKVSKRGARTFLEEFNNLQKKLWPQEPFQNAKEWQKAYLTDFFQWLALQGHPIHTSQHQAGWLEMDTMQDYERAGEIITPYSSQRH